jgi:hypothetical protein
VFEHSNAKALDYTYGNDLEPFCLSFVTSTKGSSLLVSRITAATVAQGEIVLDTQPESLLDFIREVQQKDAFIKNLVAEPTARYKQDEYGL